jgi:hypothetical protein
MTSDPESEDVTKNVITSSVARPPATAPSGNCSRRANIATVCPSSLYVASAAPFPWRELNIAAPPNVDSQSVENSDGRNSTPMTNSRTVRPFEIRAMNIPTNGDHEIHHAQ